MNDFVLSCRKVAPALVWYKRTATGWDRHVIENDMLTIEAGGVAYDIDGDGDLNLVFGGVYLCNLMISKKPLSCIFYASMY